ncbi:MAG: glycerate dehydrogenase [Gammaproteobacteria bacterium]|nr:MAG: glycerate dehydrogenase [Gammaproteobacteria bacterium]
MVINRNAVFLDKASLYPDDLDFTALQEVASWQWFDNSNASDIQYCLKDTEIIVSNKIILHRKIIQSSKRLKLICVAATGTNNVDIEAAKSQGITVCNVRAYATSSVVQHVFSLILSLNRKLFSYKESVFNGDWSRSDFFCYFGEPISALEGKILGIIGYGELGKAVAKVAQCFAMKVLIAKRDEADVRSGRTDLTTLLAESDVVSLHCPLTEHNYHMISEKELALMKPDVLLINAARGGLIDEQALLHSLENNQIGGVALDVLEEEPPSVNHPLSNYHAANLIITPHIAWASRESRQRLVNEIAKNIQAYQQGKARNIV